MSQEKRKKIMTEGNITKHLLRFAIPMILGNIVQLTYNAVDSIVVKRYVGQEALASVGTANPIMNIVIFFIVGICLGASVLMSEFYGAGNTIKLRKEIATSLIVGLGFTLIISLLCMILAEPILLLIRTPREIVKDAASYLRIIFIGLIFTFLYNIYASISRSMGDAKTPLYFVIIAAITNIVLDITFVRDYHMGVNGAAVATVIAQGLSGILCAIYVTLKYPMLRFKREELKIEKELLKKTVNYSWSTSMQQTVLYIGKVCVQGAVNPLGISSIATFTAVNRIDDFAFMPQQSIAQGMTTFIAQNRGNNNKDRIKNGFHKGIQLEIGYWVILLVIVSIFAEDIMKIFATKDDVNLIQDGSSYLKSMAIFYLLPAITNGVQGYFRGMAKMKVTLYATTTQMVARVIAAYILAPIFGVKGIAYACAFGWIVMLIYEIPVYIKLQKELKATKESSYICK